MKSVTLPHSLPPEASDEELMIFLKDRQTEALGILFSRYYKLVFNIACKILHDRSEAEDTMQQVFLEIYVDAHKFDRTRGTFKTWLLQYAYHRSINRRKYLALRGLYDAGLAQLQTLDIASPTSQRAGLSAQDWAGTIRAGLQQLHARERQAIELACYEGLAFPEIAHHMQDSIPNVRNRFYRGLNKLRQIVGVQRSPSGYISVRAE